MRLVDADAIISKIKPIIEAERQIYNKASWNFAEKCLTVIESAPTVSAEPQEGEWEEVTTCAIEDTSVDTLQQMRCSACKRWYTKPYLYYITLDNYCPECGARMKKG